MGRKRIPEGEKVINLTINLKQKTIDKIALEGNPKHIIERIIKEKYDEKEEQA